MESGFLVELLGRADWDWENWFTEVCNIMHCALTLRDSVQWIVKGCIYIPFHQSTNVLHAWLQTYRNI